jgi:tetratricopeptide (TPR) repeat protein
MNHFFTDPQDSFTRRTSYIIGRNKHTKAIYQAIADKDRRSYVLYFVGDGGIGKTRLLEEVEVIQKEQTDISFLWSGIIDLYHAGNHSPSGLRQAIIDGLDSQEQHFPRYLRLRGEFEQARQEGVTGGAIEQLIRQLDVIFREEYASLAQQHRLVLSFDTIEFVQHESDIIQTIIQPQDVDTAVQNWITEQISYFPNTVTLLAGRPYPNPNMQADFEHRLAQTKQICKIFKVQAFTPKEVFAYLGAISEQRQELKEYLLPDVQSQIVKITRGRPIYLALLIDLMLQDQPLSNVFPISTDTPDEDEVGKRLVEHILELPGPYGQMIYFLIHARKGLDANLLSYLMGKQDSSYEKQRMVAGIGLDSIGNLWSEAEIKTNLDLARKFAFVKTRPDTAQLFLHDAVYDLFDRYFQGRRYLGPYRSIAEYYREQLNTAVVSNREALMSALLYYEFQVDLRAAYYQRYVIWTEEAIKSHEIGFDMRLRDEVLRFLDRYAAKVSPFYNQHIAEPVDQDAIDRDCAARWVKRHIARTRDQEAIKVAEAILDFNPDLNIGHRGWSSRSAAFPPAIQDQLGELFKADDSLFWGHLLTYYGEALAYTGASEQQAVPVLKKAIELLDDGQLVEASAAQARQPSETIPPLVLGKERVVVEQEIRRWLRIRSLGRAHNNLGHLAWANQHLGRAIEHYKTAINSYRGLRILDEIADSMNNLAYAYGLKGEISWAEKLADDALELRRRLDQQYLLALSLNTRGLIHVFAHQPHRARPRNREALAIFEKLEDRRGIAMACNALGHTQRLIANQWQDDVYSPDEAIAMYSEALSLLTRAIGLIRDERGRLVEAYNERGAVYRDWAILEQDLERREANKGHIQHAREHFARAEADFKQSLELASQDSLIERADSLEDLADIFFRQSQYLQEEEQRDMLDQAKRHLGESEELIPFEYHLVSGQGFPPIEDPVEAMWQMLGKIHLARGHQELVPFSNRKDMTDEHLAALLAATKHYTLAMIYLLQFAPNPDAHRDATNAIYRRLKVYGLPRLRLVRQQVEEIAAEYRADVSPLLQMIDDVLGLQSQLL